MSYQDRIEAEVQTGHPALPCPHCGYDAWVVKRPWRKSKADRPPLFAAECGHCRVMETAHHIDGEWLGAYHYSKYPGSFIEFVAAHATFLMETS